MNYKENKRGHLTTHTITWSLPDFLQLVDNNSNDELRPDECSFAVNENSRKPKHFQLKIRLKSEDHIKFYFLSQTSVFMLSKLTIAKRVLQPNTTKGSVNQSFVIKTQNDFEIVYANTWQYITRLCKFNSYIKEANISHAISHDGSLDLCFEFTISGTKIPIEPISGKDDFQNNFKDLFISGLYSDIVMKSADDVEYKVHKAVLASRSAVLKAHFEHNTIECQTNVVSSPLDSNVLKEVLTFVYSDTAPRVYEMPDKLLIAGDYYQLGKLKNLASETLQEKLTVENAIETLQLADLHSVPNLKECVLEYIKCHASSVTETEGWAQLNSAELTKILLKYIITKDDDAQQE